MSGHLLAAGAGALVADGRAGRLLPPGAMIVAVPGSLDDVLERWAAG